MPRPKSYDEEQVLDCALKLFWERGYNDTSIQELVECTGVQRYGLYESFGDKHGLFIAALRRYESQWAANLLGELESPDASLPEIDAMLERLKGAAAPEDAPPGCFICNTATELGTADPAAAEVVESYTTRLRSAFAAALTRARQRGEVPEGLDPETQAVFLAGVVLGACVYAKTDGGASAAHTFVDAARRALTRPPA